MSTPGKWRGDRARRSSRDSTDVGFEDAGSDDVDIPALPCSEIHTPADRRAPSRRRSSKANPASGWNWPSRLRPGGSICRLSRCAAWPDLPRQAAVCPYARPRSQCAHTPALARFRRGLLPQNARSRLQGRLLDGTASSQVRLSAPTWP